MKNLSLLILVIGLMFLTSCISIHSSDVSNIEPSGSSQYLAQANGLGILALTVPDVQELENKVVAELKNQGFVKNVRVRLQMRNLFIVQLYEVIAIGER
jgi:hypothetical protein